jgi:hypothetical protein
VSGSAGVVGTGVSGIDGVPEDPEFSWQYWSMRAFSSSQFQFISFIEDIYLYSSFTAPDALPSRMTALIPESNTVN